METFSKLFLHSLFLSEGEELSMRRSISLTAFFDAECQYRKVIEKIDSQPETPRATPAALGVRIRMQRIFKIIFR